MCLLRAEVSTSRAVRTVADVTDTTFLLKQQALSQPSCSSSTFLPSSAPVAVFQLLTTIGIHLCESLFQAAGSAVTKFPIRTHCTAPRGTKHYTFGKACGWCWSSPSATSD